MKQTKNKYLRQLVRNYEIELQRPKGLKLIDQIYNQVPDILKKDITIFVSKNIHNELKGVSRYKGINIKIGVALENSTVCAFKENNLYQ